MFIRDFGERMQPCAETACENYALHE
jgi:hypothetical protein